MTPSLPMPKFSIPRVMVVVLSRDVWVKGKDMGDGVCLFKEGDEVKVETENGANWFIRGWWRGKAIRVAVIPSTL